jgi:CheY-like chemotaxis protein
MTAYSDRFVHERAAAIQPAAILQKPFRQADLMAAIGRVAAAEPAPR